MDAICPACQFRPIFFSNINFASYLAVLSEINLAKIKIDESIPLFILHCVVKLLHHKYFGSVHFREAPAHLGQRSRSANREIPPSTSSSSLNSLLPSIPWPSSSCSCSSLPSQSSCLLYPAFNSSVNSHFPDSSGSHSSLSSSSSNRSGLATSCLSHSDSELSDSEVRAAQVLSSIGCSCF